jgi:hypothetical protein
VPCMRDSATLRVHSLNFPEQGARAGGRSAKKLDWLPPQPCGLCRHSVCRSCHRFDGGVGTLCPAGDQNRIYLFLWTDNFSKPLSPPASSPFSEQRLAARQGPPRERPWKHSGACIHGMTNPSVTGTVMGVQHPTQFEIWLPALCTARQPASPPSPRLP